MVTIAQIGCGYWGPNLLRNFVQNRGCKVKYVYDIDDKRLEYVKKVYNMKQTTLNFQMRLRLITSFLNGLDVNGDTIKAQQQLGKEGLDIYEGFRNQINDADGFKELSPIEQQTVMANARNYSEMLTELQQEIQYLMNTRQSLAVQDCLLHVTASNILFDKLIDLLGGDDGRLKYPALRHVREKSFEKAKYQDKVYNLSTEIDLFVEDFSVLLNGLPKPVELNEFAILNQIYTSLIQALAWLNTEYERVEKEGMPKAREFKLPEIAVPKVPDLEEGEKDQPKDSK